MRARSAGGIGVGVLIAAMLVTVVASATACDPLWLVLPLLWLVPAYVMTELSDAWLPAPGRSRAARRAVVAVACIACMTSVFLTNWPLRAAFAVSKPALERLARETEAGEHLEFPRFAGTFLIREAGLTHRGTVFLRTSCIPAGPDEFARCSADATEGQFNVWRQIDLGEWQLIFED